MKTLLLHRHAKSSWSTEVKRDFDRPLNTRGLIDAPEMGRILKSKNHSIDLWVSSPAKRTWETATITADANGISDSKIISAPDLYGASEKTWLEVINRLDDGCNTAALFGHNPGVSDISSYLCNDHLVFPTSGVAAISFDLNS